MTTCCSYVFPCYGPVDDDLTTRCNRTCSFWQPCTATTVTTGAAIGGCSVLTCGGPVGWAILGVSVAIGCFTGWTSGIIHGCANDRVKFGGQVQRIRKAATIFGHHAEVTKQLTQQLNEQIVLLDKKVTEEKGLHIDLEQLGTRLENTRREQIKKLQSAIAKQEQVGKKYKKLIGGVSTQVEDLEHLMKSETLGLDILKKNMISLQKTTAEAKNLFKEHGVDISRVETLIGNLSKLASSLGKQKKSIQELRKELRTHERKARSLNTQNRNLSKQLEETNNTLKGINKSLGETKRILLEKFYRFKAIIALFHEKTKVRFQAKDIQHRVQELKEAAKKGSVLSLKDKQKIEQFSTRLNPKHFRPGPGLGDLHKAKKVPTTELVTRSEIKRLYDKNAIHVIENFWKRVRTLPDRSARIDNYQKNCRAIKRALNIEGKWQNHKRQVMLRNKYFPRLPKRQGPKERLVLNP